MAVRGEWRVEAIEDLKLWWREGLSASVIAARLWEHHRMMATRNAVVGKIHRMQDFDHTMRRAKDRQNGSQRTAGRIQAARLKRRAVSLPAIVKPEPAAQIVVEAPQQQPPPGHHAVADLGSGDCHWPIGDPRARDFHYCAWPVHEPGASYCRYHQLLSMNATAHQVRGKPIEEFNGHGTQAENGRRDGSDHHVADQKGAQRHSQQGGRGGSRAQGSGLRHQRTAQGVR